MHIDQVRLYRLSVVIEERNLTKAASRLGLTQPALSASIAQFEDDLGVKLLDRGRHGTFPTVYGAALYEWSKAIEAELNRAAQDLRDIASAAAGHLAVGATSGTGVKFTCQAVASMLKQWPNTTVELIEDWSPALLYERLRRRELDWVVNTSVGSAQVQDLEHEPLFETRRVFVVRAQHPVFERTPPSLSDLLEYPLVAPDRANMWSGQIADIFIRMGGRVPRAGATGNSLALATQILVNTDHFAVMTETVIQEEVQRNVLRTIDIPVSTAYWYGLYRNPDVNITPIAHIFREEIGKICRANGLVSDASSFRAM